jgi:hypothetical protein
MSETHVAVPFQTIVVGNTMPMSISVWRAAALPH